MYASTDLTPLTICGLTIVAALFLHVVWQIVRKSTSNLPLPPGPKPLPFVGNLHQLPVESQEKTFYSWGRRYGTSNERLRDSRSPLNRSLGGLVYAKLLHKSILVINSVDIARDLMEKRGANYSDRPRFVLLTEMFVSSLSHHTPLFALNSSPQASSRWPNSSPAIWRPLSSVAQMDSRFILEYSHRFIQVSSAPRSERFAQRLLRSAFGLHILHCAVRTFTEPLTISFIHYSLQIYASTDHGYCVWSPRQLRRRSLYRTGRERKSRFRGCGKVCAWLLYRRIALKRNPTQCR